MVQSNPVALRLSSLKTYGRITCDDHKSHAVITADTNCCTFAICHKPCSGFRNCRGIFLYVLGRNRQTIAAAREVLDKLGHTAITNRITSFHPFFNIGVPILQGECGICLCLHAFLSPIGEPRLKTGILKFVSYIGLCLQHEIECQEKRKASKTQTSKF